MIEYIFLDIHGVLTDGKERKRFLLSMQKARKINCREHDLIWIRHLKGLDEGREKPSDYVREVNKRFNEDFSVREYYGLFLRQIRTNSVLLRRLREMKDVRICIVSDNFSSIRRGLNKVKV